MPTGDIAPVIRSLVRLERDVSAAAAAADPQNELRVEPWRPSAYPELPAIWNWIDDGSVEIPDTARVDDVIVITASIAVQPTGDPAQEIDQLVTLTDHFRNVVDPQLKRREVLPDEGGAATARKARRLLTRTAWDRFDDKPVLTMEMLIRVDLARIVNADPD